MAWIYLTVAGLFEIGWAIGLKYTDGFTRLLPSLWTSVSMILSVVLLGLALKTLPVGTAYAVWTGIGAVGTAALGIYLFAEPATALRLICIGLILAGIVGLKLVTYTAWTTDRDGPSPCSCPNAPAARHPPAVCSNFCACSGSPAWRCGSPFSRCRRSFHRFATSSA